MDEPKTSKRMLKPPKKDPSNVPSGALKGRSPGQAPQQGIDPREIGLRLLT